MMSSLLHNLLLYVGIDNDYDDVYSKTIRKLQTEEDESSSSSTTNTLTQTEIIQSTCLVYGSIFAVLFVLFLIVRPLYPAVYNVKKSYPRLQKLHRAIDEGENNEINVVNENEYHDEDNDDDTQPPPTSNNSNVANESYGPISWMYKIFDVEYTDICDQCGVDAVTTIRLLEYGIKLSMVGVFNSAFLVPVYALMGNVVSSSGISDPVVGVSLSNLEQGSNATIATTLAAYIFFGSAMYLIAIDIEWFTSHRHKFLSKKLVPNYSIFLSGLPRDMQSNRALKEYFNNCFSSSSSNNDNGGGAGIVANVNVALDIPKLQTKVDKRNTLLPKLEHAINVSTIKGTTPMHKTKKMFGTKVESVPTYSAELEELNGEISSDIDKIEALQLERDEDDGVRALRGEIANSNDVETGGEGMEEEGENDLKSPRVQALPENDEDDDESGQQQLLQEESKRSKSAKFKRTASSMSESVKHGASIVKSIIVIDKPDGDTRNAAFVSFTNLASANLARQAVHNHGAWEMVPYAAPRPDLVNWKNVGKANMSKQSKYFL